MEKINNPFDDDFLNDNSLKDNNFFSFYLKKIKNFFNRKKDLHLKNIDVQAQEEYFNFCINAINDCVVYFGNIQPKYLTAEQYLILCKMVLKIEPYICLEKINLDYLTTSNKEQLYLSLLDIAIESKNGNILNMIDMNLLPLKNREQIYLSIVERIISKHPFDIRYLNVEYLPKENRKEIYKNLIRTAIKKDASVFADINPLFFEI